MCVGSFFFLVILIAIIWWRCKTWLRERRLRNAAQRRKSYADAEEKGQDGDDAASLGSSSDADHGAGNGRQPGSRADLLDIQASIEPIPEDDFDPDGVHIDIVDPDFDNTFGISADEPNALPPEGFRAGRNGKLRRAQSIVFAEHDADEEDMQLPGMSTDPDAATAPREHHRSRPSVVEAMLSGYGDPNPSKYVDDDYDWDPEFKMDLPISAEAYQKLINKTTGYVSADGSHETNVDLDASYDPDEQEGFTTAATAAVQRSPTESDPEAAGANKKKRKVKFGDLEMSFSVDDALEEALEGEEEDDLLPFVAPPASALRRQSSVANPRTDDPSPMKRKMSKVRFSTDVGDAPLNPPPALPTFQLPNWSAVDPSVDDAFPQFGKSLSEESSWTIGSPRRRKQTLRPMDTEALAAAVTTQPTRAKKVRNQPKMTVKRAPRLQRGSVMFPEADRFGVANWSPSKAPTRRKSSENNDDGGEAPEAEFSFNNNSTRRQSRFAAKARRRSSAVEAMAASMLTALPSPARPERKLEKQEMQRRRRKKSAVAPSDPMELALSQIGRPQMEDPEEM